MATYGEQIKLSGLLAGANLASYQYCPVKMASTAGEVVRATAVGDEIIGILQNDPADGEPADVCAIGESKAVLAASQSAGTWLSVNSSSQLQASATAGSSIIAMALEDSTAAGEIHKVLVVPNRY